MVYVLYKELRINVVVAIIVAQWAIYLISLCVQHVFLGFKLAIARARRGSRE